MIPGVIISAHAVHLRPQAEVSGLVEAAGSAAGRPGVDAQSHHDLGAGDFSDRRLAGVVCGPPPARLIAAADLVVCENGAERDRWHDGPRLEYEVVSGRGAERAGRRALRPGVVPAYGLCANVFSVANHRFLFRRNANGVLWRVDPGAGRRPSL